MSFVITCGQCSARFKIADPALAGRSFKCRKCGAPIRADASVSVSAPASVAVSSPSTIPVAPRRSGTSDTDPFANVDWSAVGGFEDADRPSDSPTSYRPAIHSPLAPAGRRSTVIARPVNSAGGSSAPPGFLGLDQKSLNRAIWLLVMGAVLVLGIFIPVIGLVAGGAVGIVGLCLIIIGGFSMLATPFQEDTMCGLMYLFVPMYPLYYLVTRWHEMKTGFMQVLLGYAFIFIGCLVMILSGGLPGARTRQMHSQLRLEMPSIHAPAHWLIAVSAQ